MAIYHCNIAVASRADGDSVVAGAAYISRSKMECERDGTMHDFTHAHQHEELVADLGVTLPEQAPERWGDRATLWNEVERVEKKADAQLARRIECALPDELPEAEQIALARQIVADRVADGHVVDACVHRNVDGHNAHLHMLEPLRRCDERGFLAKSECAYTVRAPLAEAVWSDETGEEARSRAIDEANRKANGAEFKELKGQGYEKVYKYRRGNEWRQLTPTEAGYEANAGFKRHGKTPVQETRYLNNGWNDKERAEEWREAIASRTNEALGRAGLGARVDHRSYERQGVDMVPQLHEGSRVRAVERRERQRAESLGIEYRPVCDRTRENAERRQLNALIERAKHLLDGVRQAPQQVAERVGERVRGGIDRARAALARSWNRPELAFAGATREPLRAAESRRAGFYRAVVPKREREAEMARQKAAERQKQLEAQRTREQQRSAPSWTRGVRGEQSRGGTSR